MKGKIGLIGAVLQTVIGILAICAFCVLAFGGEDVKKWILTLVLAVLLTVIGIRQIMDHCKRCANGK